MYMYERKQNAKQTFPKITVVLKSLANFKIKFLNVEKSRIITL